MKIVKTTLLLLLSANAVSAFVTGPSQRTFVPTNFQSDANVFSRQQSQLFSEVPGESPVAESVKEESKDRFTAYVVNLSYDTTQETLLDIFGEYGTVSEVFVPQDRDSGRSRGFAFVSMSTQEELDKVLDSLSETNIDDRTVYVTKARSKAEKVKRNSEDTTKIYVGNVSFDSTEADLNEYFAEMGEVIDVYVPRNQETGMPRGFAFITMNTEDAEKAIESNDGKDFMGRTLSVRKSLPRGQKVPETTTDEVKLYIGNISFNLDEEDLTEVFSEYGDVIDLYMPKDRETGRPRGFAFCTMSKEASMSAIEGTDGYELDGRILRVNEAQPKGYSSNNDSSYEDSAEEGDWGGDDNSYGDDAY